jgi:hypothetical protein
VITVLREQVYVDYVPLRFVGDAIFGPPRALGIGLLCRVLRGRAFLLSEEVGRVFARAAGTGHSN